MPTQALQCLMGLLAGHWFLQFVPHVHCCAPTGCSGHGNKVHPPCGKLARWSSYYSTGEFPAVGDTTRTQCIMTPGLRDVYCGPSQ